MKKYSFVILHYNTLSETLKCIEFIKELDEYNESQIIVVNNNSSDGSLLTLKETYMYENIHFIDSEYNVGFSRGNNLGYLVAKYKYNSEYVICMNSDVYIEQKNFLRLIENEYKKSQFDLLGPAIYTNDGKNQNPVEYIHDTFKKVDKTLLLNRLRYIKTFIPKIRNDNYIKKINNSINKKENYAAGMPLHGACIIASLSFINRHEYLFYPDTFLYGEEDIMYYMSSIKNEKLVYSSVLEVRHAEDASTNSSFGINEGRKKRFILKNSNKSLKILRELMKKNS